MYYEISNVVGYDGEEKPERVGRVVRDPEYVGGSMYMEYVWPDKLRGRALMTSKVREEYHDGDVVTIKTANSIYTLTRLDDDDLS